MEGDGTSNVGGGHGGSADGVGGGVAADPVRGDGGTGGEDVDAGSVVGVGGTGISAGGGTDGHGGGGTGRGVVASVGIVVTGGNGVGDSGGDGGSDSLVEGSGDTTTKGHAANRAAGRGLVVGDVVNTSNDASVRARARSGQDLDGLQGNLLGNSVGGSSDGSGAVGSVSVEVLGAFSGDGVEDRGSTATEVNVGGKDTSVNDVDINSLTGNRVVGVGSAQGEVALVNAVKTPGGRALGGGGADGHNLVGLNVLHIGVGKLGLQHSLAELGRETHHGANVVRPANFGLLVVGISDGLLEGKNVSITISDLHAILEDHDVRSIDDLGVVSVEEGRKLCTGNSHQEEKCKY